MADESTSRSDKKTAFLEQLRLINLSVVAPCLLLFVGASFQSSSVIEGAYQQARSIRYQAPKFVDWLGDNGLENQLISFLRE
jgi:hypothetical protein